MNIPDLGEGFCSADPISRSSGIEWILDMDKKGLNEHFLINSDFPLRLSFNSEVVNMYGFVWSCVLFFLSASIGGSTCFPLALLTVRSIFPFLNSPVSLSSASMVRLLFRISKSTVTSVLDSSVGRAEDYSLKIAQVG